MESTVYEFDTFRIDGGKRLLFGADRTPIPLTPKIFETLFYLVSNSDRVIDKDELMSSIWTDTIVEENNLNKNISVLRRVLGENAGENRFIVTVPGKGYKFVCPVRNEMDVGVNGSGSAVDRTMERPRFRYVFLAAVAAILTVLVLAAAFYWQGQKSPARSDAPKTIAILPFRPLVAENRDEALELGMADTLISRLERNRRIIVRPLSSIRSFGKLDQDSVQAGHSLDVESVLEGNIQRWGDKIRVNVRLISVADGAVLWTETYDERFTDIFLVQDAISDRIASALAIKLTGEEKTRFERRYTDSPEAYAFYLRGRYHVFKIAEEDIRKGIRFYEQAVTVDPNYALAYAEMADAYRLLASASFAPSKIVCPQAKALAQRALQIDESLAEAHIVLGWIGFLYDWDWSAAENELLRAIELSPNNSEAHRAYAHLLSNAGRHDEAVAEGRRARELAPLTLITAALEGQFLFYAGRDAEAIERLNQTIELDSNFWVPHNLLGRIYLRQSHYANAIEEFQTARRLSGSTGELLMQTGYSAAKIGNSEQARSAIRELESISSEENTSFYKIAMVYNGLGESSESLNYLEKALKEREIHITFIKVDTRWDNLRTHPRFAEIIKQLNFPV